MNRFLLLVGAGLAAAAVALALLLGLGLGVVGEIGVFVLLWIGVALIIDGLLPAHKAVAPGRGRTYTAAEVKAHCARLRAAVADEDAIALLSRTDPLLQECLDETL